MGTIRFEVHGELPPKKYAKNGNSMWGDETEARRLIALRQKALKKFGSRGPLAGKIRLALCVYVRRAPNQNRGDLDNFISGVCDGLMGLGKHPHPEQKLAPIFCEKENEAVHPSKSIAYKDDSQVMEICAKKLVHDGDDGYEVELEKLGRE